MPSYSEFFRQPHFRFVGNFFEATEAGKWKAVRGDRADFADGCIGLEGRAAAFSMNQDKHRFGSLFFLILGLSDGAAFPHVPAR